MARRALVAHRVVAALAEARYLAHVGAAFRAFQCALRGCRCRRRGRDGRRRSWSLRPKPGGCRRRRLVCALRRIDDGRAGGGPSLAVWRIRDRLVRNRFVRELTAHAEILPVRGAARASAATVRAALISCTKVQLGSRSLNAGVAKKGPSQVKGLCGHPLLSFGNSFNHERKSLPKCRSEGSLRTLAALSAGRIMY